MYVFVCQSAEITTKRDEHNICIILLDPLTCPHNRFMVMSALGTHDIRIGTLRAQRAQVAMKSGVLKNICSKN